MSSWSYQRLPTGQKFSSRVVQFIGTGKRRLVILGVGVFLAITFLTGLTHSTDLYGGGSRKGKATLGFGPPTYERLKDWEAKLPQHNLDLPFPEGRDGRYVKFSNQVEYSSARVYQNLLNLSQIKMLGWNNVLNEVLMNAHLAYESKRAYVFQDYVWKPDYYAWPESEFLERPPRTPLNAIISGPTAGGLWEAGDPAPRSVSEKWFDVVCPESQRRVINTREVKPPVQWSSGREIFDAWKKVLTDAPERCIEIVPEDRSVDGFPQVFDLYLWGTDRILSLWEEFSKSPTSRLLASSPVVDSAVIRNQYLFLPHGPRPPRPVSHNPFDRLLAMHVRRGDYKEACVGLATWNSTFYSWNLLPELPDKFIPPPGGEWGKNTPENEEKYMEHCLPTFDAIVQKVRDSRNDYVAAGRKKGEKFDRTLDVMYLLTNEESDWLDRLKDSLRADGWHTIRTSRDLVLDQEQTDVNMAVDMDIARRAAVFIGNGPNSVLSSTTYYVVATTRAFTPILPSRNRKRALPFGAPTYTKLKGWEDSLPQHNLELPFPEGAKGRYVRFSNEIQKLGWNNVFNERLLNAHLAYESNRAYVFQDYIWKREYYPWSTWKIGGIFPHTPLNAIISGPTAGGSWEPGDSAPRSISDKWFDIVCPKSERRIINTRDVKPAIQWADGITIFETWKKLLLEAPERCIEVQPELRAVDNFPQVFDLYLIGSDRILNLWESFSRSPTSRLLASSPIVNSAVERNMYLFLPHGSHPAQPASLRPFDRMLAMHLRRGDFKDACYDLAKWNSTFYCWNLLPSLPDHFTPPPGGGWGYNTPENTAKYMERCLPSFDAIVQKVRDSRADYIAEGRKKGEERMLDVLYLLTNEESDWLDQLKDVLKSDGWHTIRTSRDLVLDQEQTDVGMAVDMDFGRRAAVFIGNGWSSFTSNIVYRRLIDGKEPMSTRFY
ncbi:hypothetical protein VNI00_001166 [Paramarasmius palmivorus]|uniref:Uncharacterized protein n=1 Tax=Paramarasmius palmivorus TaxID=297713 RepID=A0AAW0E805_9AGAR